MNPFQCLLWAVAYLLCKLLWRTRWPGWLPLEDGQGAVIVCNHRSSVDPFFVQTATGRKIHWMVAREYCEHPAFRWFLSACEVIPVGRGGIDTAATKAAIRIVSQGGLVGMLPEGRINMTEDLLLAGAAWRGARRAQGPRPGDSVLHSRRSRIAAIRGARSSCPRGCEVRFGPPVDLTDFYRSRRRNGRGSSCHGTDRCRADGSSPANPIFEPQIAGRNWKPTEAELDAAMDAADERTRPGIRE